jgi:predicted amidophosphoribosyltransferase
VTSRNEVDRICVHCGKVVWQDRERLCNNCGLPFAPEGDPYDALVAGNPPTYDSGRRRPMRLRGRRRLQNVNLAPASAAYRASTP